VSTSASAGRLAPVRFTERYGLSGKVTEHTLASARDFVAAQLAELEGRPVPDALIKMGGAVTNLTAVKLGLATYDPDAVHGNALDRSEIDRQIELYRTRSADERRTVVGLQPARADIILAGACIIRTVLSKLGQDSLTVSDRGLRHGVMMARFGAAES
jgi:exopolyphosphatase / guanosine-5'-triphosphate,3'-diphosphate pyrophosphatase